MLFALLFSILGQSQDKYLIKVYPTPKVPEFKGIVELKGYLFNNSSQPIRITDPKFSEPGWHLYKEGWTLTRNDGTSEEMPKFFDNASSKFNGGTIVIIPPGDSLEIEYFKYSFKDTGTFSFSYFFDHNPRYSTLYEKNDKARTLSKVYARSNPISFNIKKPLLNDFKDFEQGELPSYNVLGKLPTYKKLEDAFNNPEKVFRLITTVENQEQFNDVCRLKNLRLLFVNCLDIDSIPSEFYQLKLCELKFSSKSIVKLDLSKFSDNMAEMVKLTLNGNYKVVFPEDLSKMTALRFFETNNVSYKSLPDNFDMLSELSSFVMNNNKEIESFPEIKNRMKKLQHVTIKNCENLMIAPVFLNAPIKNYSLYTSPKIKTFPDLTGSANTIESINLVSCSISEIPVNILKYQKMFTLNLLENELTDLPMELLELSNLQTLIISRNSISPKHKVIKQLKKKLNPQSFSYDHK